MQIFFYYPIRPPPGRYGTSHGKGAGASFEGARGAVAPKEKEKRKKAIRKKRKVFIMKKYDEEKERKKWNIMNNVKLLRIKCCFFPIFQ